MSDQPDPTGPTRSKTSSTDNDWLDELPDAYGVAQAAIDMSLAPVKAEENRLATYRQDKLKELENELFAENLAILHDMAFFRDIEPDCEEPPEQWVVELGAEQAKKRLRIAKAAWMSAKEAPVALAVSKSIAMGIIKARATEKAGPRSLNVALVHMVAPPVQFEERELEEKK
jgi:hypothetical protein